MNVTVEEERPERLVTVIVPSYNSGRTIEFTLRALASQETQWPFEVIVVDSSDDGTADLLRRSFPWVKLIRREQRTSCGEARNLGVDAAIGCLILFLDADCVPACDWIEMLCTVLDDSGAHAACGSMDNGTPRSATGTAGYLLEFFRFLPAAARPRPTAWLVGGNSAYRREVLEAFRFPDANLGDDFLYSYRLANAGMKMLFVPSAPVLHKNRTGFRTVFAYQVRIGEAAVAYRSITSETIMSCFRKLPALIWLMPPAILLWIGATVLRRRGLLAFGRFILRTPITLIMVFGWCSGFHRAVRL